MKKFFLFILYYFSFFSLCASEIKEKVRRVDAHLIIGDTQSAVIEAQQIVLSWPQESLAHEMLLRAYAANGDDSSVMKEWSLVCDQFPELVQKRVLLEEICLGILKKGCRSESIMTRLIGFLAFAQAQLPDSVEVIQQGLNDSNAALRALNVEIASHYRDRPLIEEMKNMFSKEQNSEVRVALLKAMGKLRLIEMVPVLTAALEKNHKLPVAEKKEMIATLALLQDDISQEALAKLLKSGRTWEIGLGCAMMRKWQMHHEAELLEPWVHKGTVDVQIEALRTLGFLQSGSLPVLEALSRDTNPEIGITASWALAFLDVSTLEKNFTYWLNSEQSRVRAMASAALMMHGKKAIPLAKKCLRESKDIFVRANLAMQLLKLRVDVEENAQILFDFLHTKEKLMAVEGHFSYVHLSTVSHSPLIPNKPEALNQSVRLDILNLLAIVEYSQAESAIREFLKESRWEMAGLAAETLLQEGDESAVSLIRKLMDDPDRQLQTQAALMLASWGRDSSAIAKLLEIYDDADKALKIKILEVLGILGDEKVIPFLVERLKEPSPIFRLVAASVLLQTLYH